jgi:AcrR family transcriptional regulator
VPKIAAATIAENREQRQQALLAAAATLLAGDGSFTMAEVAREVGLSRTAVYEYYASVPELVADVLIAALDDWTASLVASTDPDSPWRVRLHAWITGVLTAAADGRHALLQRAGALELPMDRRAEVLQRHEALIAPVVTSLTDGGIADPAVQARYIWSVVQVGMTRIESGEATLLDSQRSVRRFVDAALAGEATG